VRSLVIAVAVACFVTVSDTVEVARTQAFPGSRDSLVTVSGTGVRYLLGHQTAGGGFAERGGPPDPIISAWAVLGLRATGASPRGGVLAYGPELRRLLERYPRRLRAEVVWA
jgi:hypothetical protein